MNQQMKDAIAYETAGITMGLSLAARARAHSLKTKYDHFSPPKSFVCKCRVSSRVEIDSGSC